MGGANLALWSEAVLCMFAGETLALLEAPWLSRRPTDPELYYYALYTTHQGHTMATRAQASPLRTLLKKQRMVERKIWGRDDDQSGTLKFDMQTREESGARGRDVRG